MHIDKEAYKQYVEVNKRKSNLWWNLLNAFWTGGLICCVGEGLFRLYLQCGVAKDNAKTLESVSLIFIAAVLTGFGVFDRIAKIAGAGTLVPITGFSNAVIAPALDNKHEGFVLGVGAKMFTIAGPVIVYGTIASIVYGIVYFIIKNYM